MHIDIARRRAVAAHKKRWGASLYALAAHICYRTETNARPGYPERWLRVKDPENGSVTDWDFSSHRLRRVGETPPTR